MTNHGTPRSDDFAAVIDEEDEFREELALWTRLLNETNRRINSFKDGTMELAAGKPINVDDKEVSRQKMMRHQAIKYIVGLNFFGSVYSEMAADFYKYEVAPR